MRGSIGTQAFSVEESAHASHPFDTALPGELEELPSLSAEMHGILKHFDARFQRWWSQGPALHAGRIQTGLDRQATAPGFVKLVEDLLWFHQIKKPLPAFRLTVIPTPNSESRATRAEMHGNDTRLETLLDESSDQRFAIAAHELAHYIYSQSDRATRSQTRQWFLDNPSSVSIIAYQLFNESLASAFGNGLSEEVKLSKKQFGDLLALDESFYADRFVDRSAKIMLPLLRRYLNDHRPLDKAFVDEYIQRLGVGLDSQLTELGLWLRNMVFATTNAETAALIHHIPNSFRTGTLLSERLDYGCQQTCLLQRYPELSGIVVTELNELEQLKELISVDALRQLRRQTRLSGRAVIGIQRSSRSLLYVVSGTDSSQSALALTELLQHGRIFSGLLRTH